MALYKKINTNNAKTSLHITIECNGNKNFRVFATDSDKPNSIYADRVITVNGSRTIYFSFPVSPKMIVLGIINTANKEDTDFNFVVNEKPLKEYDIWMDLDTAEFVQMAINFSQTCGFKTPTQKGSIFKSDSEKFNIKYYPIIKDASSGQTLNTPARIGHSTGIIEVAKSKFDRYTIPMRVCILLHEFSHKYKNPEMNLEISNEIGADINALYIYLGLGFSKIDAICVFANVFLKAQTDENIVRMRKIQEYIRKFENNEYARVS